MLAPCKKSEFYPRWIAGEFGNRIRIFDSIEEVMQSDYDGPVTVRYKRPSSPFCKYLVPKDQTTNAVWQFMRQGADISLFTFNEAAPDDNLTIQGEYCPSHYHSLYCSTDKLPMRQALAQSGKQYYMLHSLGLLKTHCNQKSYDMLMELADMYPDAVIEFSCYSHNLGTLPGNNTIVWEIRGY